LSAAACSRRSSQECRIEYIPRLPELEHDKAADECLIERPRGEHAEIVDVACLVALKPSCVS
jgi:hypothetical protein